PKPKPESQVNHRLLNLQNFGHYRPRNIIFVKVSAVTKVILTSKDLKQTSFSNHLSLLKSSPYACVL
ncbi:MAG: hypothetical protein VW804_12015, partial [Verrucomicrobiota bacterium]